MKVNHTAVVVSAKDPAGMAIKQQLLKNYGFEEVKNISFEGSPVFTLPIEGNEARLYTTVSELHNCEGIDARIPAELFVFASKHSSQAAVPSLTTHSIGNWGKAEFGGRDGIICRSPASLLKLFLQNLDAVAKSGSYTGQVVQEVTHHGPYLETPTAFIEVGSSEKEWSNLDYASMVADSLIGGLGDLALLEENGEKHIPVIGLGGPHYASKFKDIMLDSQYAVGHICPKHSLGSLTPEMLRQALDACVPQAKAVVLDWKGLGEWKQKVVELLKSSDLEYFRA